MVNKILFLPKRSLQSLVGAQDTKKPLHFTVMPSESEICRGSQTHRQDGFSEVTFMLDLEGGEVGVLVEFWTKGADGSTES